MNALDTYPREELFQIGRGPAVRVRHHHRALDRPAARARAVRASTASTISSRCSSTCRATATIPTCAPGSATISPRSMTVASRPTTRTSPKANWSACISSSAAMAARRRGRAATSSRTRSPNSSCTFGDRLPPRHRRCRPPSSDFLEAFSPAYQSRNTAEEALADIDDHQGPRRRARHRAQAAAARTGGDGAVGLKVYHRGSPIPLSGPRADAREFRLPGDRRAHLHGRRRAAAAKCYIHDMVLETGEGIGFDARRSRAAARERHPRRLARRGRKRRAQPADRRGRA